MIKKQFLFPECYINKVPYCDKCKKEKYNIRADELQGEWKIVKIKTIRVLEEIIDE